MRTKIAVLIVLLAQIACTITVQPKGVNTDKMETVSTEIHINTYRRACDVQTVRIHNVRIVETRRERR